jgi:hypothetical protein
MGKPIFMAATHIGLGLRRQALLHGENYLGITWVIRGIYEGYKRGIGGVYCG